MQTDFPIWLLFAVLCPICWAIVHVLDAFSLKSIFSGPTSGFIASGFTILLTLPFLFLMTFQAESDLRIDPVTLSVCALCGFSFMASQYLYFQALSISESGIVAAYWNLIPVTLFAIDIASGFSYGFAQMCGAFVLIVVSITFCLLDDEVEFRWRSLMLMTLSCMLQVVYFLLQKTAFETSSVAVVYLFISIAMCLAGLFPLLFRTARCSFVSSLQSIRKYWILLVGIEVANTLAIFAGLFAVKLKNPSLVAVVESATPGFTFLLASCFLNGRASRGSYFFKYVLVCISCGAIWLLN